MARLVQAHELAAAARVPIAGRAAVPAVRAGRTAHARNCGRSRHAAQRRLQFVSLGRAAKPVRALPLIDEGDRREARIRSGGRCGWMANRSAPSALSLSLTRRSIQAIFRRRRHQLRRPALAKIRPGRPAPGLSRSRDGPGTLLTPSRSYEGRLMNSIS